MPATSSAPKESKRSPRTGPKGSAWHHCRRSELGFAPERGLVLQAVVTGEPAHQLAVGPILQDAADILASNAGHGAEIALRELLTHQNAAAAHIVAERFREAQQCAGHASLDRKKAGRRQRPVGLTQAPSQKRHHMAVALRVRLTEGLERGAADEAQF